VAGDGALDKERRSRRRKKKAILCLFLTNFLRRLRPQLIGRIAFEAHALGAKNNALQPIAVSKEWL